MAPTVKRPVVKIPVCWMRRLQKVPRSDLLGSVENICSEASILLLIRSQLGAGGLNQLKKTGPLSHLTRHFHRGMIYFGLNNLISLSATRAISKRKLSKVVESKKKIEKFGAFEWC